MKDKFHVPDHQWAKQKRKRRIKNKKRDRRRAERRIKNPDNWWRKNFNVDDIVLEYDDERCDNS